MLESNSIRYCTDIFGFEGEDEDGGTGEVIAAFKKSALLVTKVGYGWKCTNIDEVTGINVLGDEPDGTARRVIFDVDGVYKYFSGTSLVDFTKEVTLANVLKYGNTAAQLANQTNIPGFVGKLIRPIIALEAPSTASAMPTIRLTLNVKTNKDKLSFDDTSPRIALTEEDGLPEISEINPVIKNQKGTGKVDITVKLFESDDDTVGTDYMPLENAYGKEARAVQFKMHYEVSEVDEKNTVTLKNIVVSHTSGQTGVSNNGLANLYSTVVDYEVPLQKCYLVVRHDPLIDSWIECYVNFMHKNKHRELIQIGTGTGSLKEYKLGVDGVGDKNIVASSVMLYVDGVAINDFSYNSASSTVYLSAKKNYTIFASYDYDHDAENWLRMSREATEPINPKDGTCTSYYAYTLPDSQVKTADGEDKTVSNVRLRLRRPTGDVVNENLGTALGEKKKQLFYLPHVAKESSIKFDNDNVEFDFDTETNIVTVAAPKGTPLNISYHWVGAPFNIYSFVAGWSVA